MKQRVAYFDQMKGLAIILVVIGHLTLFSFGQQGTDVNRWLEIFHMPIFFYISGFFAYKVLESPKEVLGQLWKKVRTIVIPLLVWCALWTTTHDGESLLQMLSRCGGRYWFLYTLGILAIFFIAYEQLVMRIKNPYLYVASWLIPFVVLVIMKVKWGGDLWLPIDSMTNYYHYYLVGYLCKKYLPMNNLIFKNSLMYAAAAVLFALQFVFADNCIYPLIFLGAMGAIILTQQYFARFDEEANQNSHILRCLTYVGTKTLPIYLIHYYFIPNLTGIIDDIMQVGNPFIWQLLFCLILTAPIIAASLVVESLIDRNPYLSWILFGKE